MNDNLYLREYSTHRFGQVSLVSRVLLEADKTSGNREGCTCFKHKCILTQSAFRLDR